MGHVIIIGGGVGGLATAAWLADYGHDVTVFERHDRPGGQLTTPAPTPMTLTLPAALRDLFGKTGRRLDRELTLLPADPAARYATSHGVVTFPHASRSGTLSALHDTFGRQAADQWDRLMQAAADIWQTLRPALVERAATARTLTSLAVRTHSRQAAFSTLADLLHRADVSHPAIREVVAAHAYAVGADPEHGPASVITRAYLDQTFGLWQIDGGPVSLVDALVRRATERGALIHTGIAATRVEVARRRVAAVHTDDGERHVADTVVSAVPDAEHRRLLARRSGPSSSIAIGSMRFPATGLDDATHRTRTVVTPSADTPCGTVDLDPDGNLIVHVCVDRSAEFDAAAARRILSTLAARDPSGLLATSVSSGADIHDLDLFGPDQWAAELALGNGSPHGPSGTGRWALAKGPRPRTSVHGLYRAGVATQPGSGIDTALLSAAVVADLIGRHR